MDRITQQMEHLQQQMQELAKQREVLAKQMAEMSVQRAHLARQAAAGAGLFQSYTVKEGDSVPSVPHAPAAPMAHPGNYKAEATQEGEYAIKAVKPDTVLEIVNQVGSITVTGSSQSDCTVKTVIKAGAATRERAEEIARRVQIRVTPEGNVVRVAADIPEDLRNNKDGEGIQISFEVTVPEQVCVQAAQQVGDIRLASLAGDVKAVTNVGTIRAAGLKAGASLVTNVGDINLTLPANASAEVKAKTGVGAIKSDLPTVEVTGAAVIAAGEVKAALGSSASGTLGAGEHKVDLQSHVGTIKIQSEASKISQP
jgi:hypothetical protein